MSIDTSLFTYLLYWGVIYSSSLIVVEIDSNKNLIDFVDTEMW